MDPLDNLDILPTCTFKAFCIPMLFIFARNEEAHIAFRNAMPTEESKRLFVNKGALHAHEAPFVRIHLARGPPAS